MRRKLKEPMVRSLSEAARIAKQTERERPCTSCIRYNPNALFGRCNFAKADFRHTCFIERYEFRPNCGAKMDGERRTE